MRHTRTLSLFALAGAVGLGGAAQAHPWDHERPVAPSRDGMPPVGAIRGDIVIRAAQDGRGDTGGRDARDRQEPRAKTSRPDSDVGQAKHFAAPIRSDVLQRVSMGDGPESLKQPAAKSQQQQEPKEVKVYPGRHENPPAPLPIKSSVLLKVSGGGEAGGLNENRGSDDPKLDRNRADAKAQKTGYVDHNTTKVYPGRHEQLPSVPELFMTAQKRHSAQGDNPGDKDGM